MRDLTLYGNFGSAANDLFLFPEIGGSGPINLFLQEDIASVAGDAYLFSDGLGNGPVYDVPASTPDPDPDPGPACGWYPYCCGDFSCIIFSDSFNRTDSDDIGSGWNELVGNALISGNVLSIDASASDARILCATPLVGGIGSGKRISVRLRADSGERIVVLFYDDANNYMEASVRFSSSATGGRMDFNEVSGGAVTFSHNQEYECGDNEYDIPDGEWATLTLEIMECGGFGYYVAKFTIETATDTHSIGWSWIPPTAGLTLFAGVGTTGTPTLAEFDDFVVENIEIGWPLCPAPMTCCSWGFEAISLGYDHGGWDYTPAVWEPDVIICTVCFYDPLDPGWSQYVERTYTSGASQFTVDHWVNSNVDLSVIVTSACDEVICPIAALEGNQYRLILENNPPNSWWVECEALPTFTYPGLDFDWYWTARLQYGGVTQAYILFARDTPGSIGSYRKPTIRLKCYDCQIEFGMGDIEVVYVFWSDDSGAIKGWAMLQTGWSVCFDASGVGVAGTGNIGFQAGNVNAYGAGFAQFTAQCSRPFDCENTGTPYVPPDDEPDPVGCCTDFEDVMPGHSIEVDVAGVTWEAGPWCVDGSGDCIFDFDFMALVNATWVMTMTSRTATEMRFFALGLGGVFLGPSANPCDQCGAIDIGWDIDLPFLAAAELVITNNEDGTCTARMYLYLGACDSCVLILSATFTDEMACDGAITLAYESGDGSPGLRDCCIQGIGGSATLYLP
jgi:hypothetical protein